MIERDISGHNRGFIFGTHTFRILRDLTGINSIEEVFERLVNKKTVEGTEVEVSNQIDHIGFICTFLFACAKHYNQSNKIPIDFEEVNVSDWVDELGLADSMKLVFELIKTYSLKNLKAPVTGLVEQQ